MTPFQRRILTRFESFNRDAIYFTTNGFAMTAGAAQKKLQELAKAGLLELSRGQSFKLTRKGVEALSAAAKADSAGQDRFCNNTTGQVYIPPVWNVRAGGNDALAIKTRGTLC